MPAKRTFLFVINKKAGRKKKTDYTTEIKLFFGDRHHLHFFYMKGYDLNALTSHIEEVQPDVVIAVGGDGTLSFVAEAIMGKHIALGIIPAGSANGMAAELGIPDDLHAALEIIENGTSNDLDLIRINDLLICIHLSDVGLNARLVKHFEEGNVRGKLGYFKALFKTLFRRKKMQVAVMTKDRLVTREAEMILIANATKYGTGFLVNPQGNISDGLFEVVILRKINLLSLLKMFLKFKKLNSSQVELLQATKVVITSLRKMHFQVDGEYVGKVNEVNAEIVPAALKVILPTKISSSAT